MHTCRLALPQCRAELPHTSADSLLLLIGGGRAPSPAYLTALMAAMREETGRTAPVWAIDRGVDLCRRTALVPAHLIGDGDSADPEAWAWARAQGAELHAFPPEKDDTDTALALQIAAQCVPRTLAVLTAAFGGRLDHLFSAAVVCAHAPVPCVLTDEYETLFYLRGGESLNIRCSSTPRAVSLLPFTEECTGVSTRGLHWELNDAAVSGRTSTTISNVLAPENTMRSFSVSIEQGVLGVYLCHTE